MAIKLMLQLFADGGDGAATGEAGNTAGAVPGAPQGVEQSPTATAEPSADDRAKAFAQFKTDYKDLFDAEVQGIVKDRLKKTNAKFSEVQSQLDNMSPMIDLLSQKYGTSDVNELINAVQNDDSMYEDEAYERGMTTEQVKEWHKIERENARLKAIEDERRKQAVFADWARQEAELKQIYPNFDFQTEMQSENFARMLNAGTPMRKAFEVNHIDELMQGAMQFTAGKVATQVTNSVAANQARPSENGLNQSVPTLKKMDISNLSKEDMDKLIARAAAGEKIDFNH